MVNRREWRRGEVGSRVVDGEIIKSEKTTFAIWSVTVDGLLDRVCDQYNVSNVSLLHCFASTFHSPCFQFFAIINASRVWNSARIAGNGLATPCLRLLLIDPQLTRHST